MRRFVYALFGVMLCLPGLSHAAKASEHMVAPPTKAHPRKVLIQLDTNNVKKVNMILNNAENLVKYYGPGKVRVIIDAYGPGIHSVLAKASKVPGRIMQMSTDPDIEVTACDTTLRTIHKTGKDLVPGVSVVPGGIAEIADRKLAGWVMIYP